MGWVVRHVDIGCDNYCLLLFLSISAVDESYYILKFLSELSTNGIYVVELTRCAQFIHWI